MIVETICSWIQICRKRRAQWRMRIVSFNFDRHRIHSSIEGASEFVFLSLDGTCFVRVTERVLAKRRQANLKCKTTLTHGPDNVNFRRDRKAGLCRGETGRSTRFSAAAVAFSFLCSNSFYDLPELVQEGPILC